MRRLSVVVPLALILIFALLYMALGSCGTHCCDLHPAVRSGGRRPGNRRDRMPLSVSAAVAFIVSLRIAWQKPAWSSSASPPTAIRRPLGRREPSAPLRPAAFRPLSMTALCSSSGWCHALPTGLGADTISRSASSGGRECVGACHLDHPDADRAPDDLRVAREQKAVKPKRRPRRETGMRYGRSYQQFMLLPGRHRSGGHPGS